MSDRLQPTAPPSATYHTAQVDTQPTQRDMQLGATANYSTIAGQANSQSFDDTNLSEREVKPLDPNLKELNYLDKIIVEDLNQIRQGSTTRKTIDLSSHLKPEIKNKFSVLNLWDLEGHDSFNNSAEIILQDISAIKNKYLIEKIKCKSLVFISTGKNDDVPALGSDVGEAKKFNFPKFILSNNGLQLKNLIAGNEDGAYQDVWIKANGSLVIDNCNLKSLQIRGYEIISLQLKNLSSYESLQLIGVKSLSLTNCSGEIPYYPDLEKLELINSQVIIPDEYFQSEKLQTLYLKNSSIGKQKEQIIKNMLEFSMFGGGEQLTNLEFYNCISISIENNENLKNIYIFDTNKDKKLKKFSCINNSKLSSIQLDDCEISADFNIKQCNSLTSIATIKNNIGSVSLGNCPKLKTISIYSPILEIINCQVLLKNQSDLFLQQQNLTINDIIFNLHMLNIFGADKYLDRFVKELAKQRVLIVNKELTGEKLEAGVKKEAEKLKEYISSKDTPMLISTTGMLFLTKYSQENLIHGYNANQEILFNSIAANYKTIYNMLPLYKGKKILEEDVACVITMKKMIKSDTLKQNDIENNDDIENIEYPIAYHVNGVVHVYEFEDFIKNCLTQILNIPELSTITPIARDPLTRKKIDFSKLYQLNNDNIIWK